MTSDTEIQEARRSAILRLLARRRVRSQEELVVELARLGFEVTQSSVSRDLRQLGVAKAGGRYVVLAPAAAAPAESDPLADAAHHLREARAAGPHLTVVLTAVGAAQSVGIALDRAGWPEIVGTIAGDDTVFVASVGRHEQTRLLHRLRARIAEPAGPAR